MNASVCSRAPRRQTFRLPAGLIVGIAALLVIDQLPARGAQQSAPSAEEVSFARLGCRNCHGSLGEGRRGKPGGPILAKSRQTLRRFVGYTRMPMSMMPPYAPRWASDAELAILYRWLDGMEAVKIPLTITVELKRLSEAQPEGQVEFEMTALRAANSLESESPAPGSLGYRVTLITNGKGPVAKQRLEYELGSRNWSSLTTDQRGEALLDSELGFILTESQNKEEVRTRLRMAVPSVRTVLVIEAIDSSELSKPVVVGLGTAILRGQ